MITKSGIIPAAIWMLEPTETPIVSSIFPLQAIQTEVTCSAALPTNCLLSDATTMKREKGGREEGFKGNEDGWGTLGRIAVLWRDSTLNPR